MLASGLKMHDIGTSNEFGVSFIKVRRTVYFPTGWQSPAFGHFLGRRAWTGPVDNWHSRLQTSNRYSLHLPWLVFVSIAG